MEILEGRLVWISLALGDLEFAGTIEPLRLHIPSEAENPQNQNSIPVRVEFVPGHAVTGGLRIGVMVVVPALTERQERHPEAVPGIIMSAKAPSSPHMRGGVDQPGRMEPDYRTKEDAPQNITPPAHSKKEAGQYRDRHPVPAADPHLEAVFAKLGYVGQELF